MPPGVQTVHFPAHFQALVRDVHRNQVSPQFFGNTDIPFRVYRQKGWWTKPAAPPPEANALFSAPCDFPPPPYIWAHDELTQPANPAKNEPKKIMSCLLRGQHWDALPHSQACTGPSAREGVPVPSCEAGTANSCHPRCHAKCRYSGFGIWPEKGIKLSHLLLKQPNAWVTHRKHF